MPVGDIPPQARFHDAIGWYVPVEAPKPDKNDEATIMRWLFGAGPDFDGKYFGECECCEHGPRYWWRRHLRKMLARIGK